MGNFSASATTSQMAQVAAAFAGYPYTLSPNYDLGSAFNSANGAPSNSDCAISLSAISRTTDGHLNTPSSSGGRTITELESPTFLDSNGGGQIVTCNGSTYFVPATVDSQTVLANIAGGMRTASQVSAPLSTTPIQGFPQSQSQVAASAIMSHFYDQPSSSGKLEDSGADNTISAGIAGISKGS